MLLFLYHSLLLHSTLLEAFLVFSQGCNYSCSGCHAKRIAYAGYGGSAKETLAAIDSLRKINSWTKGVVICGGEPTIHNGLESFCGEIKERGLEVKLDTNGSNPEVLGRLIERDLLDYIAMDMKGPLRIYPKITQRDVRGIVESLGIVGAFRNRELRTTLFPLFYDDEPRWMNVEEAREMADEIARYTRDNYITHYLQGFRARDETEMIDPRCSLQQLPDSMQRTPKRILDDLGKEIKKALPNSKIRN